MAKRRNLRGFAHQGLLVLLVIAAVIAAVGYRVVTHNSSSTVTIDVPAATATNTSGVTYKADLQQASKALDADPGSSQLDPSQLDAALNQLL